MEDRRVLLLAFGILLFMVLSVTTSSDYNDLTGMPVESYQVTLHGDQCQLGSFTCAYGMLAPCERDPQSARLRFNTANLIQPPPGQACKLSTRTFSRELPPQQRMPYRETRVDKNPLNPFSQLL